MIKQMRKQIYRIAALLMAIVTLLTALFTMSVKDVLAGGNTTPNVYDRVADSTTMESYKNLLISDEWGSRYAGRLWSDKSVFEYGKSIDLTMANDGYNGKVTADADFLHAFSALGSG